MLLELYHARLAASQTNSILKKRDSCFELERFTKKKNDYEKMSTSLYKSMNKNVTTMRIKRKKPKEEELDKVKKRLFIITKQQKLVEQIKQQKYNEIYQANQIRLPLSLATTIIFVLITLATHLTTKTICGQQEQALNLPTVIVRGFLVSSNV